MNDTLTNNHFFYTFACTFKSGCFDRTPKTSSDNNDNNDKNNDNNNVYSLMAGTTWEETRFLIEKRHGLFDLKQSKPGIISSYIVGYMYSENWRYCKEKIHNKQVIKPNDLIILMRKPCKSGGLYVPKKYQHEMLTSMASFEPVRSTSMASFEPVRSTLTNDTKNNKSNNNTNNNKNMELNFNENMTEEEKIDLLVNKAAEENQQVFFTSQITKNKHKNNNFLERHPSDIDGNTIVIHHPPPVHYVCHNCFKKGHWKHLCESKQVIQPKFPVGIPKTMLKEAQTLQEKESAMVTSDGKLVVLKNK